ncbi:MAG TPA: DUF6504 family protein [Candidatus Rubrimentiphilum sp.]|nr:DUF6504 family protein [Candidatus Rubrimentiphilum sp.]
MSRRFLSEPLKPLGTAPIENNVPGLPDAFDWRGEKLKVADVLQSRRSTKEDRGDVYLKRHWFEFRTTDGRIATVYFDREARGTSPHWWIYTLEDRES